MTEQLTEQYAEVQEEVPAGPPAPVRIAWAPIARVNLLPIEIMESRRFRRTQLGLAGAVVGAMLVAGAGTFWTQRDVGQAQDELVAAQTNVTGLQAQQAKYAAVPQVIAQVNAADTARTLAMHNDILWYRYLNDLNGALPSGVELTGMTVVVTGASTTGAADALSPAGVGTLSLEGISKRYSDVAAWLDALNDLTGLASSSLSSASKEDNDPDTKLTFSTGAIVNSDALSGRYDKKAG